MCAIAARHADAPNWQTAIPRLSLYKGDGPTPPISGLFEPKVCIVLQGAKQIVIGEQVLRYDPATCFVASVDLPVSGCIIEASAARPYIGLSLDLDPVIIASLLPDVAGRAEAETQAFAVGPVTPEFLDPWVRLLALLDTPEDIGVLAPMVEREILYRLLRGPQGALLRQAARTDSRLYQIRAAIGWIRDHYDAPLSIEALAGRAGMSLASFHRHFKAATAMSPLQYQKTLRLQQARLLLAVDKDAARAAYAVGYESASQFSREYSRLFGLPPGRDAARLREGAPDVAVAI